ncbi:predicted protein [Lichtheimia corymbifera JMRC:FSU:9682]|uniref:Uncharacterized protein n=1 Tax=Lichtheimia corymbifera JMRC:FSU:9682 TaxID=1263082 RepID=A0A068SHG7_9FUNG|nr:predicted protein [Lichtheimia corymbifera JMRC:FSU:9682]
MSNPENVALVTWHVVSKNNGPCRVDTAEVDDGLDGIDKSACIYEGCCTATDDIGELDTMHAAIIFQSWTKDDYDGSNHTSTPVPSI